MARGLKGFKYNVPRIELVSLATPFLLHVPVTATHARNAVLNCSLPSLLLHLGTTDISLLSPKSVYSSPWLKISQQFSTTLMVNSDLSLGGSVSGPSAWLRPSTPLAILLPCALAAECPFSLLGFLPGLPSSTASPCQLLLKLDTVPVGNPFWFLEAGQGVPFLGCGATHGNSVTEPLILVWCHFFKKQVLLVIHRHTAEHFMYVTFYNILTTPWRQAGLLV